MYDTIFNLPDQIKTAFSLPLKNFNPEDCKAIDKVVYMGMGGSGIVGNVLQDLQGVKQKTERLLALSQGDTGKGKKDAY